MAKRKNAVKKVSELATPKGKEWIQGLLRSEVVTITFDKRDGTSRELHCTLIETKIPEDKRPKGAGKAQSDEALAVFDVENQGWRSFRYDSVRRIEFGFGKDIENE